MALNFTFTRSNVIPGLVKIEYNKFEDHRGLLWSTFVEKEFSEALDIPLMFNHDKFALNKKNVLRGIHGDFSSWKYVTVLSGEIFQVFVDNRKNSPSFMNYVSTKIRPEFSVGYLIPPGVGNGFLSLAENTLYNYKLAYTGNYKDYDEQFTVPWNDNRVGITWPIKNPVLSERDAT